MQGVSGPSRRSPDRWSSSRRPSRSATARLVERHAARRHEQARPGARHLATTSWSSRCSRGRPGIEPRPRASGSRARRMKMPVSKDMLGRILSGVGRADRRRPGDRAREAARHQRAPPSTPGPGTTRREFIQTGISTIDGMNTLVRGQKLPIFSGSGLPHNEIALQIARQAKVLGTDEEFAVVFARHGHHERRGAVLHEGLRADRRARAGRRVPEPGRRPGHRAHHHPAAGPDDRRVPRLRARTCTCWSS